MQNEFIEIIGEIIQSKIVRNINESRSFSIVLDGTQDISVHEQLSFCVRYVDSNFKVRESFLGFWDTSKSDSTSLLAMVEQVFQEVGLVLWYIVLTMLWRCSKHYWAYYWTRYKNSRKAANGSFYSLLESSNESQTSSFLRASQRNSKYTRQRSENPHFSSHKPAACLPWSTAQERNGPS